MNQEPLQQLRPSVFLERFWTSVTALESKEETIQTAQILACTIWLLLHRILLNRGFMLRKHGLTTDTKAALLIGSASSIWFATSVQRAIRVYTAVSAETNDRVISTVQALEVLSRAPIIVQTLFIFWSVSWLDGLIAERNTRRKPHLWNLANLRGPFDWASGSHRAYYWALVVTVTVLSLVSAICAFVGGNALHATFVVAGLLVFALDGVFDNPYASAKHTYTDDQLRIALPTSHHEGTMYVLPSTNEGFGAVWAPKIAAEHCEADGEIMTLFADMRSGKWSVSQPLERLRKTMAAYHKRVVLSTSHAERLAAWLYLSDNDEVRCVRKLHCQQAAGVHLIGRDLMFALCHAEYLVFMAQNRLQAETRAKLGILRLMTRSGAPNDPETTVHTIGYRDGIGGYKEAVEHVYAIFDQEVDPSAYEFSTTRPPRYSFALHKTPANIDEYVSELWNLSTEHSESTFSALYFFTTVWFMEIGNVNGFHIFPVRCINKDGDLTSQLIAWRQAWYSGIIAQLTIASPVLFFAYVSGFMDST